MEYLFNYVDNFIRYKNIKSILQYRKSKLISTPEISVIMPIYNNPDMFKKALLSVINQKCEFEYEIVIVDNMPFDGGKDEELKFIEGLDDYRISYFRNSDNIGMYGNWNRGIELARGEYVTYCHNDDILEPYALQRLYDLQKKYGKRLIASEFNLIDDKGKYIKKLNPNRRIGPFFQKKDFIYTKFDIFLNNAGFGVGCLFNRNILLEIGGFNPDYYPSADYALFIKYIFEYGGVFNRIPTFNYRKAANESYSVYKKFVERDKFFRECMLDKMHILSGIGKFIIAANYNYGLYNFTIKWGNVKDKNVRYSKLKKDYGIMVIINKVNSIRRFTIRSD